MTSADPAQLGVPPQRAKNPVSPLQEVLWRREQTRFAGAEFVPGEAFRLRGDLDREVLDKCIKTLLNRHESLRDGFLFAEVSGRRSGQLVRVEMPATNNLAAEQATAFDLAQGGLFRATLTETGAQEYTFVLRASLMVADDTALEILLEELNELYEPTRLPELERSYSQYVAWHRGRLTKARVAQQLSYWRGQIGGALPVVELPADHSRARATDGWGTELPLEIPAETGRWAESAARELAVPIETLYLAALKGLLLRYTGEEDVLVATTADLRQPGGFERVVGCCTNTVLLRTDLSGRPTFEEAVRRVHETLSGALSNRDVPCGSVLEAVQPERVRSGASSYQVRFEWLDHPPEELRLAGVAVARLASQVDCDLILRMWRDGDGYAGALRYQRALFETSTMVDFARHFLALVAGATQQPQQAISDIPFLDSVEQQHTAADYPRHMAVQQLFERQVVRTPDAVAVSSGGTSLTYQELNRRANRLARHLVGHGMSPRTLVGLCVPRSIDMLAAVLGVLKAGGAYVPLDPSYPEERLAYMIQDSRMPLLITKGKLAMRLPPEPPRVVDLEAEETELEAQAGTDFEEPQAGPEDLAYVLYTSGSSGKPKGVEIPHRAVVNFLSSMAREPGLGADDVVLAVTTLSFDIAGLELFLPLAVGARIVLAGSDEAADGARLRDLLHTCGVTAMQATPATWRLLLEAGWEGSHGLKVLCGGEALSRPLADELLRRCGSLWNMYGPTETTIWSTVWKVEAGDGPILIGHPIANTQVYVLDSQRQPVPVGVAGELYIDGDGLMRGYRNRPDLTAEALVDRPGACPTHAYKTGDLVRWRRDGNLEFVGRIDQQVKWHGFRIELGEIEAALARHPQLRAAAALVREDAPGRKQLVAYCVPEHAPGPGAAELRRFLSGMVPSYMVPSVFVSIPDLPRTPNGKTNRRALPAPDSNRPELDESYVAPRNPVEKRLAAIWQDVLGIRRIGITDNYFDLGAESLVTAEMFVRIQRQFGRRISPGALFRAPTIEQLGRVLGEEERDPRWSCMVPVVPQGSKPALFCIHGGAGTILFFYDLARYLGDDRPVYALQAQGLYGGAPPHSSVEEMAQRYLQEIRAVQERGPYYLVGYCFGAIVAYEMAQRLLEEGEEVAILASLNGPCPRYRNVPAGDPAAGVLRSVRSYLRGLLRKADRWRAAYYRRQNMPLPDALRERFFLVNNSRAEHFYQARPYPGSMAIFRAKGLYGDPYLGWAELVVGGFTVCDIPGYHVDHRSMMEEPAVKVLAGELRRELRRLEAGE